MAIEQEVAFACPDCGHPLVNDTGWPRWCTDCDWGVLRQHDEHPVTRSRWARWLEKRMHARVLARHHQLRDSDLSAGAHVRAAAFLLALVVHLSTLGLLAGAALVWLLPWPTLLRVMAGALLLILFVAVFPRQPKPDLHRGLTPQSAPATFRVLSAVAERLGAHAPDIVVPEAEFNASFGRVGWRRKRVLTIGLPLWSVLDDRERLSLLAHELGHDVNDDVRSHLFVGTAVHTLAIWSWLWDPGYGRVRVAGATDPNGPLAPADYLVMALMLPITAVLSGFAIGLHRLASRSGQRAEYRADLFASQLAGSEATHGVLRKSLSVEMCTRSMALGLQSDHTLDVWQHVRDLVESVPESEWQRLERRASKKLHRTDETHPPTTLRAEMVSSRPPTDGQLSITPTDFVAMSAELFAEARDLLPEIRDAWHG